MPRKRKIEETGGTLPLPDGLKTLQAMGPGAIAASGPPRFGTPEAFNQEMDILGMITMPEDWDPIRYSDQFSTEKTYLKAITQREQCSWTQQPAGALQMNNLLPTETFVASFRGVGSLWRRFLLHDTNPERQEYTGMLKDSEFRSNNYVYPEPNGQINFNIVEPTTTYQPHGTTLVAGRTLKQKYANASWFWLDGVPDPETGEESDITVTHPIAAVADCSYSVIRWAGGKFLEAGTIDIDIGETTGSLEINVSDYYTILYTQVGLDNNFPAAGVTITTTSFCSVLRHIQVQEAYKNMTQIGPQCVRAASLRVTEMAAPLNIQGEAAVANTRENGTWWEMYAAGSGGSNSVFRKVVNYRDAYLGPLRLGGYAYHLPHTMEEFNMEPCNVVNYDTNTIIDVWFNLEDESVVNVYSMRTINQGTWFTCLIKGTVARVGMPSLLTRASHR